MFHPRGSLTCADEDFAKPVESIMRCEDFKSNFARKLSNRYTSRPVSGIRETVFKLHPAEQREAPNNVPERIELFSQLSKSIDMEFKEDTGKPPDKSKKNSDIRSTEVNALNLEVETLRWQLGQTETNRQMHIALLKQIVTFLNRVKEHIVCQKIESPRKESTRGLPRSFNVADLPRSRSVLHVNKSLEYSINPKKISTRKISKSISNVNGYKDYCNVWNQSKLSFAPENDTGQKITEEMTRLITLANTVLSTKLPDLVCACTEGIENDTINLSENNETETDTQKLSSDSLNLIQKHSNDSMDLNINNNSHNNCNTKNLFSKATDRVLKDYLTTPTLSCVLENDFSEVKLYENEQEQLNGMESPNGKGTQSLIDFNHASHFIEDESGFSSMSSFQEIGIPIISIIPPSPCKEVSYMEELPDVLEETEKWKSDAIELDKQSVKVFWV